MRSGWSETKAGAVSCLWTVHGMHQGYEAYGAQLWLAEESWILPGKIQCISTIKVLVEGSCEDIHIFCCMKWQLKFWLRFRNLTTILTSLGVLLYAKAHSQTSKQRLACSLHNTFLNVSRHLTASTAERERWHSLIYASMSLVTCAWH